MHIDPLGASAAAAILLHNLLGAWLHDTMHAERCNARQIPPYMYLLGKNEF